MISFAKRRCVTIYLFPFILILAISTYPAESTKDTTKEMDLPKRMVLTTPDGKELLLREDNYWEPEGNREIIIEKDFTVPLKDGRFVLINADGTWSFVQKELQYAEEQLTVQKVTGKGKSQHIDVNTATNNAVKSALDDATLKTKAAVKKIKLDVKKIRGCIERVEKDTDTEEVFVAGKGWIVNAEIILDMGSLLAVIDCARDSTILK